MEPAESDTDLAAGGTQYRLRTIYLSLFIDLGVPARLSAVINDLGITTPTPIQQATLPDALAGRDVLGRGRTGSGKTLAFLLPMVARLSGGPRPRSGAPRGLILAPTRELAGQIEAVLAPLAKAAGLTSRTVFGGVGQQPQVSALRRGVDIVVACPGRLEDLMQQGHCSLAAVEITVIDEADHMADLGFLPAVKRILARTAADGQRMLFSATLDNAVDALVRQFLSNPAVHQADSAQSPISTMTHHVLHITRENRLPVLVDLVTAPGRSVVFTRTKRGAKTLTDRLQRDGVRVVELHGNLAQNARTRNLDAFHSGRATVLVATDIAARGIHVDDVRPGHPRRPARRPQGLPAPLGTHGARRQRGNGRHVDDERPGPRGGCAHPRRRHQGADHPRGIDGPPRADRARPGRAGHRGPDLRPPARRRSGRGRSPCTRGPTEYA